MAIQIVSIWESNGVTAVDREHVLVSLNDKDEVLWQSNHDFTVTFKDSPFAVDKFDGGKGRARLSGWAQNGTARKAYKYTVQAGTARPLDPVTHVDP